MVGKFCKDLRASGKVFEFNFYFLKLGTQNESKGTNIMSGDCLMWWGVGSRQSSRKKPLEDGNILCFDWSVDYIGVNICPH